jgi:hypothetical protein
MGLEFRVLEKRTDLMATSLFINFCVCKDDRGLDYMPIT